MSRIMKIKGVWNTKQAVLSSVVFLGCLSGAGAEANTGSSAAGAFNGLYGGASLGYVHQNTNIDAKQDPHDARADMHHSTTSRGVPVAEIFLGWGKVFGGCFYGGFEGKIDWVVKGAQKVAEDTNFRYDIGRKGICLATLIRLGYLINPHTLIYAGGGIKISKVDQNLFEKADQISAPFSKRSLHFLTEVGLEVASHSIPALAYRFSYSFMPPQKITRGGKSFLEKHVYRENGFLKTGLNEHAFKAGMVFRF